MCLVPITKLAEIHTFESYPGARNDFYDLHGISSARNETGSFDDQPKSLTAKAESWKLVAMGC